jgi:hypothetical protein
MIPRVLEPDFVVYMKIFEKYVHQVECKKLYEVQDLCGLSMIFTLAMMMILISVD